MILGQVVRGQTCTAVLLCQCLLVPLPCHALGELNAQLLRQVAQDRVVILVPGVLDFLPNPVLLTLSYFIEDASIK